MAENEMRITFQNIRLQTGSSFGCQVVLFLFMLHHATRAHHKRPNVDMLLGQQIHHQVEVGRPDWLEELQSVRDETESLGEEKCGIFLCGPTKTAEAVYEASVTVSKQSTGFHMYFSKETF